MKISPAAVHLLGSQIAFRSPEDDQKTLDHRTFVAFYGTTPEILSELWDSIDGNVDKAKLKHLLWACMYMKLYLPEDVMCVLLSTSKPTLRKWSWKVIERLALTSVDIISWDKRKRNLPADALCSISVDGTDFKIQEPYPFNKKWKSEKYSGSALKYEVAISIFSGDIVWVYGPHRGGKHDLSIFREALLAMLDDGELVEADLGYRGESDFIRIKEDYCTKEEKKDKDRIRARTESCNQQQSVPKCKLRSSTFRWVKRRNIDAPLLSV